MSDDLISRAYLRKMAMLEQAYTMETEHDKEVLFQLIEDAPAVYPEVRRGRWIEYGDNDGMHAECLL